ncbi:hypothetical protein AMELA_G00270350 [Ameiurus melas]|uniref:Uncharacterized protein n=1 Tax=Ameiurus melas TaxID=219545 RepID=A0A7J5ZNR1_AMEME|nr:hypothetical protein AMELA_G00270350 [Ameiurus melas]
MLALNETWIHAENTATPTALASNFNFSHTSRHNRRGGGTGQLGKFLDEFDMLLSTIPDDGTPLLVLDDKAGHRVWILVDTTGQKMMEEYLFPY